METKRGFRRQSAFDLILQLEELTQFDNGIKFEDMPADISVDTETDEEPEQALTDIFYIY